MDACGIAVVKTQSRANVKRQSGATGSGLSNETTIAGKTGLVGSHQPFQINNPFNSQAAEIFKTSSNSQLSRTGLVNGGAI